MKLSPLQLQDYFVAEFHFSLNSKYDVSKGLEKKLEEMEATPHCQGHNDNPLKWTVELDLKYQPAADTNTPYIFSLKLVGFFEVSKTFDPNVVERLVHTNGPSVLYSIAREIVREQTARGPDGPFILPTASFLTPPPEIVAPAATAAALPEEAAPTEAVAAPRARTKKALPPSP